MHKCPPKLQSRLKDRDECLKKFELKYRHELEKRGTDYNIKDHITDLIGVRVICLYETDIVRAESLLSGNFEVLDVTDKTQTLTQDVSSFGYKGLHLDLRLKADRLAFPEYAGFADFRFEVQIRSIVQDAWSEIDHKLKYKRQIPDLLKRRIIRLAALFELADQEFEAIREQTAKLEEAAASNPVVAEQAERKDEQLDAFSFLSVMQARHPGYTFDPIKVDGFVDEIKRMKPDYTVREFNEALLDNGPTIREYRNYKYAFNLNPFTEVRHILYLSIPNIFDAMLYPRQRDTFLEWLTERPDKPAAA